MCKRRITKKDIRKKLSYLLIQAQKKYAAQILTLVIVNKVIKNRFFIMGQIINLNTFSGPQN